MAKQIPFSQHEAALLLDAYLETLKSNQPRHQIVQRVSDDLRVMAINQGLEIDDVFRNTNGITFQMASMESAYKGQTVMKPATRLFTETVKLYREDRTAFERLLKEAKSMVANQQTTEEAFASWLSEKVSPSQLSQLWYCYHEIEAFCRKIGVLKQPLFMTTDLDVVKRVQKTVSQNKIFTITHRKKLKSIILAAQYYTAYIKECSEKAWHATSDTSSDTLNIAPIRMDSPKGPESGSKDTSIVTKAEKPPVSDEAKGEMTSSVSVDLLFSKDNSDEMLKAKLDLITQILQMRYKGKKPTTLLEVKNSNEDLPIPYLNTWTNRVKGQTAKQYLIEKGIIVKEIDTRSEDEKRDEKFNKLKEITSILIANNSGQPVTSLSELARKNPEISFTTVNSLTRELFGVTASEYFREKGILTPLSSAENTVEKRLKDAIHQLKTASGDKPLHNLTEINSCGLGVTIATLNNWTKSVYRKSLSEYLVEEGLLIKENIESVNASISSTLNDQQQNTPSIEETPVEDTEDANDEPIGSMELSMFKTLEYLKTRYKVRQQYYHNVGPACYAEYRIRNNLREIMRVEYSFSSTSQYISIETEPQYLGNISDYTGFTHIKKRTAHPRLSLFFDDYSAIRQTLVTICDSVDSYFSPGTHPQSESNRTKLYEKLYSISKVYDDPLGLSLSRIMSILGNDADPSLVTDILDEVPWAVKLSDEVYSFSPNAKPIQRETPVSSLSDSAADTISEKSYDRDKLIQTLMYRYRNGMTFDSIDFDVFRETYEMLFEEPLPYDDAALEALLRCCGVLYKDRLFPADGIIDPETRNKLYAYIDGCFASGKTVLYYKAILSDLAGELASCYTLADEEMLRVYLEFTAEKVKYHFTEKYLSIEQNVTIDHNSEVADFLLSAGKPMTIEAVASALSHIPPEQVQNIIYSDGRFIWNSKGEYFHKDIFEVSKEEIEVIADIISGYINENEYAIWTDVWNQINEKMSVFLENNLYLSPLGIRNALAPYFSGRFNFVNSVISSPGKQYEMKDIFQLFAKHHPTFTADDVYSLCKKLDVTAPALYLKAIEEVSVRVSSDSFVSKDQIAFDVDAADTAIGSFMAKDYICLREIDFFLSFPNVGYEWNEYLLESFVLSYSKKFMLLNNGMALYNAPGAIVKRGSAYTEFVDVCAAVLADSHVELKKSAALNYLAKQNLITQKRYKHIELAIQKAGQLRLGKR